MGFFTVRVCVVRLVQLAVAVKDVFVITVELTSSPPASSPFDLFLSLEKIKDLCS